jgi:hypothetical protein
MKKMLLATFIVTVFAAGTTADERAGLFWRNKTVEAELALAKTNAVYFIVDETGSVIQFKAKGVVLREWKMARFGCRAPAWPIVSTALISKQAIVAPKRKHIDPQKAEEIGSYELDALESKDMPADFVMTLENDLKAHVSSEKENLVSLLSHWELSLQQAIFEEAQSIWWSAFRPRARMIQIRLAEPGEARTLCWSLSNGMKGLILFKID